MKIFLYLRDFPVCSSPLFDGSTKAVHGLATGFAAAGAEVTILTEASISDMQRSPFGYGVRSFAAKPASSIGPFRTSEELLRFVARLKRGDLLLLNGIFSPRLTTIARVAGAGGRPYVVAPHDPYNPAMFSKSPLRKCVYWRVFEKPLLDRALAIQVLDRQHEEFLRRRGVRVPTIEVPNGYERSDAEDVAAACDADRDASTVRFYFLGRLDSANKGLDLLIRAFASFAVGKAVDLTLQGPDADGDAASLRRLAGKLRMGGRVHFLAPDFNRRAPELIAQYDIFCLTSRYEGFSLSTLEAMLAKRAVLVSSIAGIARHVAQAEAGVVAIPTVGGILDGLERLWSRRGQWPEMGANGRRYVLGELSWEKIARAALGEYQRILSHA